MLLRSNRLFLWLSLFFLLLTNISTLSLPYLLRRFVDNSSLALNTDNNAEIFVPLLIVSVVLSFASGMRTFCIEIFCTHAIKSLRMLIFKHILTVNPQIVDNRHSGDILSVMTNEMESIKTLIYTIFSSGLRNVTIAVCSTCVMIYTNPLLSAYAFLFFPIVIVCAIYLGKQVRKRVNHTDIQKAFLNTHTAEIIQSIKLVNAFSREKYEINQQKELINSFVKTHVKKSFFSSLFIFIAMFSVLVFVVTILWLGTLQTEKGILTSGELTQFAGYAFINALVLSSVTSNWSDFQNLRGHMIRVVDILNTSSPIRMNTNSSKELAINDFTSLTFSNVCFDYSQASRPTLTNIDITIQKGQKVAIVGPSGSGKSTLFKLLLRFYDPNHGTIMINGQDIRHLNIHNLRDHFAYLPQESTIFSRNIAENIGYALSDCDTNKQTNTAIDKKIITAAKIANIHSFIDKLPHKYHTLCGEKASNISGGEKQRLAIARTLLTQAPCLLLDEPTNSLDSHNENLIRDAVDTLIKDRTAIIIAHRLNTVKNADSIYVIEDGHIVAQGRHEVLMKNCSLYNQLITKQFT